MVIYFTGTGNSRRCARIIAQALGDELVDSTPFIKENSAPSLCSEAPWVFVCPTYAWQMVHIFEDFIRRASFSGSRSAYFVLTCGGDIGNAAGPLKALCRDKGFDYMGTLEVVMPENYVAMFSVPGEEECAKIIASAQPVLLSAAECITFLRPFPAKKVGLADRLKSGPVNVGFYKYYVKADGFYSTDKCVGCGKCAEVCPLCNIALSGGRPSWGKSCTHCMACICSCPAGAIEYGKRSIGKRRYLLKD